ncbi:hypothetical protein [Dehalobacter sp. TeCB1]|uniref:hypothetical protein n=1 Tax=Dehalobacter sp. TeCB1 TaxID=1843715 RepID=UPI00083AA6F0|nr:hypothetical protein [Dehalobacter sp. TeCB1]OCZ49909.1 hypothetical protein A7D23_00755 [Dehalobacter sp. TeCB1]
MTDIFDKETRSKVMKKVGTKGINLDDKQMHYLASALYHISQHAQKFDQTEETIFNFIKTTKLYKG